MAEYCDSDDVEGLLPADHGFTGGDLTAFIVRGSDACDGWLRRRYRCPLPDHDATPGTPQDVRQAAAQYAARIALGQLGMANRAIDNDYAGSLKRMADEDMRQYAEGKRDLPTIVVTGEEMTFGTDPLGDDEYKLVGSQWLVDRDTVEIEGFEYGMDFKVEYRGRNRGWILTRLTTDIADGTEVSYEYDYFHNAPEIKEDIDPTEMRVFR